MNFRKTKYFYVFMMVFLFNTLVYADDRLDDFSIQTDIPKKLPPVKLDPIYPASVAMELGPNIAFEDKRVDWILGVQVRNPSMNSFHFEYGAHILGHELGGYHAGIRWILEHERVARPQLKVSIANELRSGDSIDKVFAMKRFGLKMALTLEAVNKGAERGFRLEIEPFVRKGLERIDIKFGWRWPINSKAVRSANSQRSRF